MNIIDDWSKRLVQNEDWTIKQGTSSNDKVVAIYTEYKKSLPRLLSVVILTLRKIIPKNGVKPFWSVEVYLPMPIRLSNIIFRYTDPPTVTVNDNNKITSYKTKKEAEKEIKKYIKLIDFVLSKKGGRI